MISKASPASRVRWLIPPIPDSASATNSSNSLSLVSRSMMGVFMLQVLSTKEFVLGSNCELLRIFCSRLCVTLIALQRWRSRANGVSPINLLAPVQKGLCRLCCKVSRPGRARFCRAIFARTHKRWHDNTGADGRSHRAFSDTANQRTAKSGPTMRRDDDQIGPLLCSGLMDRGRAVSGNGRCTDRNTIEIDALQESSHLFTTSPARCFGVSGRIVIPAGCRHHHRAEVSHVKHDNARANLLCEPDRKFYTRQGTIREVHRNQNRTNESLACTGARTRCIDAGAALYLIELHGCRCVR